MLAFVTPEPADGLRWTFVLPHDAQQNHPSFLQVRPDMVDIQDRYGIR
jgi:hypothetical protein